MMTDAEERHVATGPVGPLTRDLQPYRDRAGSGIVSGMEIDRSGMEVLSREASLRLLETVPVGRVVVSEHALPVAFPVNFAILDGDVVFRTSTGSKLGAAVHKAVLAFEADRIDSELCSGWSVLVQGWASLITRPDELARAEALGLHSWAPGTRGHFVRIHTEMVSGRRLLGAQAGSFAGAGCG
jgi:nitroimidazol reductase NimA-like FMN-containing flavoprotein (pyridoxamine 5'-phosphate oxidase superfamily)